MAIKRSTGLVDKLNGVKTNKLLNGAFSSATTNWSSVTATLTSVAGGQAGNCLSVASTTSAAGRAYQDITTVVGRLYRLSVYFKQGTGASGSIHIGTTGSFTSIYSSTALSDGSWTLYEVPFIATATTTRITFRSDSTNDGETALFDTAVAEESLDGFIEIMRGCQCNVYTTARPATADAAATGTLLATVTLNSGADGLTFTESSNGVVSKPGADVWSGSILESGEAAWFRFYEHGDDPTQLSTTAARFDGSIGTSGADMIVGSTTLTQNLVFTITGFDYTAPKG